MRTAIVLGAGGRAVREFHEARALAPDALLIAVNVAVTRCRRPPDAFVTLHPEKGAGWKANAPHFPEETYSSDVNPYWRPKHIVREKWGGTSGLYAAQIALEELEVERVILAGVPILPEARSLYGPGPWSEEHVDQYRAGWLKAFPRIVGRVRSVSGWTRDLLGYPSTDWLGTGPQLA